MEGSTLTESKPIRARVANKDYSSFRSSIIQMAHSKKANISSSAVGSLDGITRDLCIKITNEASNLAAMDRRDTVTPHDVATAVRLLFKGSLGTQAAAAIATPVSKVIAHRPVRKGKN